MSNLQETPVWVDGIYQLTEETPVLGKQEDVPGDGPANIQAQQLANRTQYLKAIIESIADGKEHTFYKTATDPDGTIAGIQGTDVGLVFRVAQGGAEVLAFNYYLNDAGVAKLIAVLIGQGSVTNNIRFFASRILAENDLSAGNILNGSKCWVMNTADETLADEYINNGGMLEASGRSLLSSDSLSILRELVQNNLEGDENNISRVMASANDLAESLRSVYQRSKITINSTGESGLSLDNSGLIIFDSVVNADTSNPQHVTVKDFSGSTALDLLLLPGESLSSGILTTHYVQRDFFGLPVSDFIAESGVVRAVLKLDLSSQELNVYQANVFDKTGMWAAVTQFAAPFATAKSVSSHSAGGIQLVIPNADITAAGYELTKEGVQRYLSGLDNLFFWYKVTSVAARAAINFAVVPAGAATVIAGANVTISASAYSAPDIPKVNLAAISRTASQRIREQNTVRATTLALASGGFSLPEPGMVTIGAQASQLDATGAVHTTTISKAGITVARLYWPGGSSRLENGTITSKFRPFTLDDLTFHSRAELSSSLVRVRYVLPAGFGLEVDLSDFRVMDTSGLFVPVATVNGSTTTQTAVSASTVANTIQFSVMLTDLAAAGYGVSATDIDDSVRDWLVEYADECLFMAYTGTLKTYRGYQDFFSFSLDAGDYTLDAPAFTYSGKRYALSGSIDVCYRQSLPDALRGDFIRLGADVMNATSVDMTNMPVQLKVSFPAGAVPDTNALDVMDMDGNVFECQFADEFHPNIRTGINRGRHQDKSLASGSIFIRDSIAAGAQKFYEVRAYRKSIRSGYYPGLVPSANGYTISVGGYVWEFNASQAFLLTAVTDPSGTRHNIAHELHFAYASGSTVSEPLISLRPRIRLVSSGPVFTEVEITTVNMGEGSVPDEALRSLVRVRLFSGGKCRIYVMTTSTVELPASTLYGVTSRINFLDGAYTYDAAAMTVYHDDETSGKRLSVTLVSANGDTHRDGTTYGPNRPMRAIILTPSPTTTRMYAGWQFTSVSDASFTGWTVPKNWTWSHEFWIDMETSVTSAASGTTAREIVNLTQNLPAGFIGECGFPAVRRRDVMDWIVCHVSGTMEWFNSAAATPYGGGTSTTKLFHSYTWEVMKLVKTGKSTLDAVYFAFKAYMTARWGTMTEVGPLWTSGSLPMQFSSRLVVPVWQYLYDLSVSAGGTAKVTELKAAIKSYADAILAHYQTYGGVPVDGRQKNSGPSNSNATALRVFALAIHAGLDTDGSYLSAFNGIEALLTNRDGFMKAEGIITDGPSERPSTGRYLHYQLFAANNYVIACRLLGRVPKFDCVNLALQAATGGGGFNEIDYCISESRRGSANTISFAMMPLILSERPSALNLTSALVDVMKTQYGPRPGFPLRFYNFDGTTSAGQSLQDLSFVATTLADLWLWFYFNN